MYKTKNLVGLLMLLLLLITSCQNTEKPKDDTYTNPTTTTVSSPCLADSAWFAIDPTTGKRNTPAPDENINSVFGNNTTVTNCDFHRWSWQKFLWLTNDVGGRPFFLTNLLQVDAHVDLIPSSTIMLTSNVQATGNVLRTNKSFNSNDISYDVYYSIHVDSSLYNSIQNYAPMDTLLYKDSTFPVGALELKIAWVDAAALEDTTSYFITAGNIEGINTRIALLGMHVTGIVYNHPEFVWATFEHQDLVPYYDWAATTTTDVPVTSTSNKLLFSSSAIGTLANITLKSDSSNVFAVNQYGVPREALDSFIKTSQAEPENYDHISEINTSVKGQLTDIWNNYFYNGSIWLNTDGYNYPTEQAQLLVSLGGTLGNAVKDTLLRGSLAASNITMETYEQLGFAPTSIHDQNVTNLGNCFSCHTAQSPTKGFGSSALNISHIFNGAVDKANGLSKKDTKQKHLDKIKEFIKAM
jgi:hypothetical protein